MVIQVYLAGFEVFAPDGVAQAESMRQTCRKHGLEPISPLDAILEAIEDRSALSRAIYEANIAMISRADVIVANANHFRGPDPDAGTCFEVGYAVGLGKTAYVYSSDGDTAIERVQRFHGPTSRRADGAVVDSDGYAVEDFGGPFNLMLTESSTVILGSFDDALAAVAKDHQPSVVATG